MSKEIKFIIKEDKITEYLTLISEKVQDQSKDHLYEMADLLTSNKGIEKHISHRFNRNLYKSGQDQNRWFFEQTDKGASIAINYTGMTHRIHSDDFLTWIEFSDEFIEHGADTSAFYYIRQYYNQSELHLNRDYAFYQEKGIDEYADKDDAKYTEYVEKGINDVGKTILNKSAGYLKNIINNRR